MLAPAGESSTNVWAGLAGTSPKFALRTGAIDSPWADTVLSLDWTPIRSRDEDTSLHRFRLLGSYSYNARLQRLNLSARAGVGMEFLRVSRPTAAKTLIGWALEPGIGVWVAAGDIEVGGELALPMSVNGNAIVGDLAIDSYLSANLDVLIGVRRISR